MHSNLATPPARRELSPLPPSRRVAAVVARALALLLVGFILVACFMGASRSLHTDVHPDANEPGHLCLATLIEHHLLVGACPAYFILGSVLALLVLTLIAPPLICPDFSYRFSLSRGPPALLLSPVR